MAADRGFPIVMSKPMLGLVSPCIPKRPASTITSPDNLSATGAEITQG